MAGVVDYILIHGGCHGAWCWHGVQDLLEQTGIKSHAFDLPGCGDDATPRATIRLADMIDRCVEVINGLPDGRYRVVGHSIGGWLLPPVGAAFTDGAVGSKSLVDLTFVAGATLQRGESGMSVTPVERRQGYFDLAAASGDNSLMLDFDAAWARFFNHLPRDRAKAVYRELTPQAFGPYLDPSPVGVDDVDVARTYIAMDDDLTYPEDATTGFARKAGVKPVVIPGDHDVMLSNPTALVQALLATQTS